MMKKQGNNYHSTKTRISPIGKATDQNRKQTENDAYSWKRRDKMKEEEEEEEKEEEEENEIHIRRKGLLRN